MNKVLNITDSHGARANISDLETWGDPDTFKLICKASSKSGGWMKSTKAMEIPYVGCVVQVTTQQGDKVAEALTWVPFATVIDVLDDNGTLIGRRIGMHNPEEVMQEA